jgi:hypothetical protein
MRDHLQKWMVHVMMTPEQLDKYNLIWSFVPAYHDLTPNTKSYEEVSERNGKEMKEMSRYLLGVVTMSLRGRYPTQHLIFNHSTEFAWVLSEWYMYALFKSHDNATSSYMENAMHCFHTFRDVVLLMEASKKAKAKVNALRTELVKMS